ncbi:MAG: MmcQ/YjbR family DNA-binding protein [Ginsengibacter sp.]
MALSFDGTITKPHFDRTAFKIKGKRIFATLHEPSGTVNLMLTLALQNIFCKMSKGIHPVANKWGEKGWTTFDLKIVEKGIIQEGIAAAWKEVSSEVGKQLQ